MTAHYTDAEKAAARRIGYSPVLKGDAPSAAWLADFKRIVVETFNDCAREYRASAARIRREAEKAAAAEERRQVRCVAFADDARTVARAVAREQRKAARS